MGRPYFLALLAEGYKKGGQAEVGLGVLDEVLAAVQSTGERWWEAELYRLKGELVFARSSEDYAETETCFQHAIDIACHQQAKSLELRAAMSLSRLGQQQGKRREAASCWHRSTAGSLRGLTRLTSRKPRRFWRSCHEPGPHRDPRL